MGTTVSFVLRLLPDRLADGAIAGEVERISDGEATLIKDVAELEAFLKTAGALGDGDGAVSGEETGG